MGQFKRRPSCNWNRWQQTWNTYVTSVSYNKHNISTIFNYQFAFSAHILKTVCIHDPSETLQRSCSLTVVHYVIGSVSGFFQRVDDSCCKLGIILVGSLKETCPIYSYFVVSWIFCCWILCDGGAEMATGQCKYSFLSKLTPATSRTLIYQKLSTSWRRRSDVPNKSTMTLLFYLAKSCKAFIYLCISK